MTGKVALEREATYIRHVRRRQPGETGGIQVLGDWYLPQPLKGVNGEQGWQSGVYEPHEGEEGTWAVTLPNVTGGDGLLHRRRFLIFTEGKSSVVGGEIIFTEGGDFRAGDEFVEIYEGDPPAGRLLWVGAVTGGAKRRASVEVRGVCALPLTKHAREKRAGFWTGNSPRDVFEHYTRVWRSLRAENFAGRAFVFSTSLQTTPDGVWDYTRCESVAGRSVCQLRPVSAAGGSRLLGNDSADLGTTKRWRLEVGLEFTAGTFVTGQTTSLEVALADPTTGAMAVYLEIDDDGIVLSAGGGAQIKTGMPTPVTSVALEGDRRWVYAYVDGALGAVVPTFDYTAAPALTPSVTMFGDAANPSAAVRVTAVDLRAHEPFLLRGADKGDYQLPGSPTPGGLVASYHSERDTADLFGVDTYLHLLKPTKEPAERRQESDITLAGIDWPAAFQGNPAFSVRLTGAIYLDLATTDLKLGLSVRGRGRLWVGQTQPGDQVVDYWASAGGISGLLYGPFLRDLFGPVTGWYPLVVEYSSIDTTPELAVIYDEGSGSNWTLGSGALGVKTSPLGCFSQQLQGDSHYEVLMGLRDSFGHQFTCEPRSLESGEFPGQVIPRLRLGRDTAHVLDDLGAVEPVSDVNAEDTVDELVVDGSGLSDPAQAAQQTQVAENVPAIAAGRMMIHTEQESLSDISDLALLRQRAESLLALHSAPWEEVQAQPEDKSRDLLDSFPLTGELAEFDWAVGDGLRLAFEEIDLVDELPRQLKVVSWPIRPDGRGAPAVGFRQRPRDFVQVLRRLVRLAQAPQRNYQGQLVTVSGNVGAAPTVAAIPDAISRVNLPENLAKVVRAELVVQNKSNSSTANIQVNGSTVLTCTAPGRFDITPYVARSATGDPRMYAAITGGTHTSCSFVLELLVAV